MGAFYLGLGAVLFSFTALDIIKTTFSSMGGGKITDLVSKGVWSAFFAASGRKGSSRLLPYAGPSILLSVLLVWVLGLWLGLFLMLLSEAGSIVNSTTKANASVLEKLYYAGFTLSTLGVGDFVASTDPWRIVTGVAAFSGLAFITASITYFVPVLSAVGLQSKLSLYISSMGKTPQQILANAWDGKGFPSFLDNTSDLCQMLIQHTMNHHSYPVIHYFHNSNPKRAIAPGIVLLDEAHKLLRHAVSEDVGRDELRMAMLQTALDSFLEMLNKNFLGKTEPQEPAPFPNLDKLREKGIPLRRKEEVAPPFARELQEHRRQLTTLLEMGGWSWREVYGG